MSDLTLLVQVKQNGLRTRRWATNAMLILSLLIALPAHAATPVRYDEPTPDLIVKVLGGTLVVQRSFYEGRWYLNQNWSPLTITYDSFDGSVKSIARGRALYNKLAPGVYRDSSYYLIRQTSTGFLWFDRAGNTLTYDINGNVQAYADRNGVGGTFTSETTTAGVTRLTGIRDHLGNPALTFEYTGNDLTRIYDRTNREVRYLYNAAHQLTQVTDANGQVWIYGYTNNQGDPNGYPTSFTDPENRTTTRDFGSNGEINRIRYADNTGEDYWPEYDTAKNLYYKRTTTTSGRVTETWMTLDQRLLRKDINGKTVETHVPEALNARLRTSTDARNLTTTYDLDEWANVTKTTYPDGITTSTTYDPVYSNPLSKIDERGVITKFDYDAKGNLLRMTEALGLPEQRITEYSYDQYGQRKTMKRLADAVTQEALTQYEYDTYGNVIKMTDAENNVTLYPSADYDGMGNAKKVADARGKVWIETYDNKGNLLTKIDPLNHITTFEYDKTGWLIRVTDTISNVIQYNHDVRGNIIAITDPYGAVTRLEYNDDNQRIKITDAENRVQVSQYDLNGRISQQIDGNGNVIQYIYGDVASGLNELLVKTIYPTFAQEYKYDKRNRIVDTTDIMDTAMRYSRKTSYDAVGNVLTATDPNNKTTINTYDNLGRRKTVTDPLQGVTQYTFDNRDNLIALADPKQQPHRFTYDRINRTRTEVRPMEQAITTTYISTGQVDTVTDPKGQIKKYTYDDAGRITGESYYLNVADFTNNIIHKAISYTLNDLNRHTGYSDGNTIGTITYDLKQLRKTGESVNYGTFSLNYNYDYFTNGRKKSFTGPDGVPVNYTYDLNNQLATIQLPTGSITVNSYQWFAPAQITYPGGSVTQQQYDPLMRLKQIQVKDPGQTEIMNYQYGYDNVGNIKTKTTEHGNYVYDYDDLYRLTTSTNPSPLLSEGYTYDAVGNRLTDSKTTGNWTYNANNQFTGVDAITYEFDSNGNTTKKTNTSDATQTKNYVYDTNDRLTEIRDQNNVLIASYSYDPYGRRISKDVAGIKTWFFYADEGLIAQTNTTGIVTKTYGYRPDSTWSSDPVYIKEDANTYYFQNDHLGTSQKLVTNTGSVVWSAKANAFGNTTVDPLSTITNNLRFPGQFFDAESELHYNWNRYYDPQSGRYITRDPIGLKGGMNTYIYANNRPLKNIDPTGNVPITRVDPIKDGRCGYLRIMVLIHCKSDMPNQGCNCERDTCPVLLEKLDSFFNCIQYQTMLTAECFAHDPTHEVRIKNALNSIRKCIRCMTIKDCVNCPE
jgi:RHS repeat-associated protein